MDWKRACSAGILVLSTVGCFHQVVQTGQAPSPNVVEKNWVSTWLFGLVAATPIDVRSECPSGVATIETEQSFMNGLVGGLTLGIWAPQHVKVTCAASAAGGAGGAADIVIAPGSTAAERAAAVEAAIKQSIETHKPVVVHF